MSNTKIAVIGLGYVGLPLAVALSKKYSVIGYDVSQERVDCIKDGIDDNNELSVSELQSAKNLTLTYSESALSEANVYIVTLPTPVNNEHQPDLSFLVNASSMIGRYLSHGDLVVYESTVYPGATEDTCIPLLEQASGLVLNKDFGVGYSPERINPGDKSRPLTKIKKVTSGSNALWAETVDNLYSSIIDAGTHKASSIKVAEAAKVIENIQRDVNIALVNQLAQLFSVLEIDTQEVLDAAGSKWNFLPFKPGLVGGHCISVDPYYLCHKAESVGYFPDIILAARRLNENMSAFISDRIVQLMCERKIPVFESNVLVLGASFKENCPDVRNTKVLDVVKKLQAFGATCCVYDPLVNAKEIDKKFGISIAEDYKGQVFDVIVLAVPHAEILDAWDDIKNQLKTHGIVYDVKSVLPATEADGRL